MSEPLPLISVVVPVFNEVENVAALLAEIEAALTGRWPFEVIFTNDGSTDGTAAALEALKATRPHLRVLDHNPRSGQSAAVRSGVAAARGAWIATLDGDGQNDPADIPALFEVALAGPAELGLVGGLRLKRRDTWSKRVATKVGNGIRQALLRDGCLDTGCGLKVFRRDLFLRLPAFAAMHRFLPALVQIYGFRTAFVPVNHRPRLRGVSKYGNFQRAMVGIVDLLGVMWLKARSRIPTVTERGV